VHKGDSFFTYNITTTTTTTTTTNNNNNNNSDIRPWIFEGK
jgi:hypothetical protein